MKKLKPSFIVLEGLEGAGKSTIVNEVSKYLLSKHIKSIITREPGGCALSEKIRNLLIDNNNEEICCESELLLMYASRIQHVNTVIKPAIKKESWVICDRFNWSSFAYQGGGRMLGVERIKDLDNLFLKDFVPNLIIYLDVDPKTGLNRATKSSKPDRIEMESLAFFERTRDVFIDLVNSHEYSFLVNANQNVENVIKDVLIVLEKYFNSL